VQEEVGLRGAQTSAWHVEADIGLNLEVGVAGDFPSMTEDEAQEQLGQGPGLFLHDSSMLPNNRLRDFMMGVAGDLDIPLQFNVLSGYGQDGSAVQRTRGGAPVINVTVPTRYLHSHNSIIHRRDVEQAIRLVTEAVRRLDARTVTELRSFED
jgi:putative aminopeptidase FrvX